MYIDLQIVLKEVQNACHMHKLTIYCKQQYKKRHAYSLRLQISDCYKL